MKKNETLAVIFAILSVIVAFVYILFNEVDNKEESKNKAENKEKIIKEHIIKEDFEIAYDNYKNSIDYIINDEVKETINIINNANNYEEAYSVSLNFLSNIEFIKINSSSSYRDVLNNYKNNKKVILIWEAYDKKYKNLSANGISPDDKKRYFSYNSELDEIYRIAIGDHDSKYMTNLNDTIKYLDIDYKIDKYNNSNETVKVSAEIIKFVESLNQRFVDLNEHHSIIKNNVIKLVDIKDIGGSYDNIQSVIRYKENINKFITNEILEKLIKEYRLDEDENNLYKLTDLDILLYDSDKLFLKDGNYISLLFDGNKLYINCAMTVFGESTLKVNNEEEEKQIKEKNSLQKKERHLELSEDIEFALRYYILKNIINANVSEDYVNSNVIQDIRIGGHK